MTRKLERELKRQFPNATIDVTGGNHYRLRLPSGKSVTFSGTPRSRGALRLVRADVRRQMKEGAQNAQ
ncbi:hypothetical protein [Bradyrhizobium lablabi]|uniref:hypothetical protein n=1 Tax=Bradyrhizobium lablabi TaxID=722472 RepID=UPI001BA66A3A|nr:hypothetical protein [Bradyrhizobium lablabi]MBR0694278.1 hypothetical protein [Bradyrhizobium lablabi]